MHIIKLNMGVKYDPTRHICISFLLMLSIMTLQIFYLVHVGEIQVIYQFTLTWPNANYV